MNFLLEETSSNNNMTTLVYVIVLAAILIFSFRAAIGYPRYRKSIFPHIYDNYLIDYFYKLNVFQDASRSGMLKKMLGHHRIVYANLSNKEGKLCAQILTILHSKGILSIAYLMSSGTLEGSDSGNWFVKREEEGQLKKYKLENPAVYLKEYLNHLADVNGNRKVEAAIAVSEGCDISAVHCRYPLVHYSDLKDLIKNADCGYGLNDNEIDELFEKLGGKIDRK